MIKTNIDFRVVIPARFASTRFPGKALAMLAGRPVIQHVWQQASASGALSVVVATDDARIQTVADGFGAEVMMTGMGHVSGTDRIAEVVARMGYGQSDIIVNVQGDAPLIPPASIAAVARLLDAHPAAALSTLCTRIDDERQYTDPNVVKVVCDHTGRALYFSRAPVPARAHDEAVLPHAWRHVGIYAYRAGALRELAAAPPCDLERAERLEQLRALWLGMEIRVGVSPVSLGPDIDTPEDLASAAQYIGARDGAGARE